MSAMAYGTLGGIPAIDAESMQWEPLNAVGKSYTPARTPAFSKPSWRTYLAGTALYGYESLTSAIGTSLNFVKTSFVDKFSTRASKKETSRKQARRKKNQHVPKDTERAPELQEQCRSQSDEREAVFEINPNEKLESPENASNGKEQLFSPPSEPRICPVSGLRSALKPSHYIPDPQLPESQDPSDTKANATAAYPHQVVMSRQELQEASNFLEGLGLNGNEVREDLLRFTLPTKLIQKLYSEKGQDPNQWEKFVGILSNEEFRRQAQLNMPNIVLEINPPHCNGDDIKEYMDMESIEQQLDGCCNLCRGQDWAGTVPDRHAKDIDSIPWRNYVTARPPKKGGSRKLTEKDIHLMHLQWCRESRWDWRFDIPPKSGYDEYGDVWSIGIDDPRLRHFAKDRGINWKPKELRQRRAEIASMRRAYSTQDLAARRLILAVSKQGNKTFARSLRKMDNERKRRQVCTDHLCIRRVNVIIEAAAVDTGFNNGGSKRKSTDDIYDPSPNRYKRQKVWVPTKMDNPQRQAPFPQTNLTHGLNSFSSPSTQPPNIGHPAQWQFTSIVGPGNSYQNSLIARFGLTQDQAYIMAMQTWDEAQQAARAPPVKKSVTWADSSGNALCTYSEAPPSGL